MLKAFRKKMEDDKGFTLIELMVVVLIIAILLAIAIPTFLRVRRNAQDRAVQSSVQTGLKAEKAFYVDGSNNVYSSDGAKLREIEASLNYHAATNSNCTLGGAATTDGTNCVKVAVSDVTGTGGTDQVVTIVGLSKTGTYWAIKDVAFGTGAGTFYGEGDTEAAAIAAATTNSW